MGLQVKLQNLEAQGFLWTLVALQILRLWTSDLATEGVGGSLLLSPSQCQKIALMWALV